MSSQPKNLEKNTYVKFFKWGVYIPLILTLITPLLFNSQFLFPFITTKTLYFRMLIEIALFFYLGLIIWEPSYRPRMSRFTWAIIIYFSVMTLASIFGVNLYNSFWGNIERGEGLLTIYHVLAMFIMLISVLRTGKQWMWFMMGAVGVSVFEAGYALMQKIGWMKRWITPSSERIFGTIGNPAFLAAYLLLGFIMSVVVIAVAKSRKVRYIFSGIALFQLLILFFTQTRGAVIALAAGFVLAMALIIIFPPSPRITLFKKKLSTRWLLSLILLLLLGFYGTVWASRSTNWVQSQSTLRRIVEISYSDITTESRLLTWKASLRGWRDRFLLGYGYENYNIAFNKYFPPEIFMDQGSQLWFDRAHNILFDQAVTGGIFGVLSYLAIFAIALYSLLAIIRMSRRAKSGDYAKTAYLGIILFVGLLAYLGQNMFVFDTLSSYISAYIILGFASYLIVSIGGDLRKREATHIAEAARWMLLITAAIATAGALYFFNIKPARANMEGIDALLFTRRAQSVRQGEDPAAVARTFYPEGFKKFKEAINYGTYQTPELRQKMVEIILIAGKSQYLDREFKGNLYNFAIEELKKNIKLAPYDAQNYMYLMSVYNASARFDRARLDLVITTGEKAIELSPTRPQIYFEMGQAAITNGDSDEGIGYFKKALELNPHTRESKWNLAAAYIFTGKLDKADKIFNAMIGEGFNFYSLDNLTRIERVYRAIGGYEQIISLYKNGIASVDDQDLKKAFTERMANLYAQYAAWLQQKGDTAKAREAVLTAIKLNPNLKGEGDKFLKSLEKSK